MLHSKQTKVKKCLQYSILLFIAVFIALGTVMYPVDAMAEPEGYGNAKVELTRLMQDKKRGEYRHNWLRIADEFHEIYRNNADWNNRPAALYRSAKALDEMAHRSYVRKDAQAAASRYEFLVNKHPINPLADDALYAAATIYKELLRNTNKSKALLKNINKKYAKSDFAPKAKIYLSQMNGNAVASLGTVTTSHPGQAKATVALTRISPQLRNNVVRIVLSMESIASWRATYSKNALNEEAGVVITLKDVKPSEKISLQDQFTKRGIFTGYYVKYNQSTAQSTVILQFSDLLRYTVKSEKSPARLIIEATNSTKELRSGITIDSDKIKKAKSVQSSRVKKNSKKVARASAPAPQKRKTRTQADMPHLEANLAAQLGLQVNIIVIDPGHGGRDPGSSHNKLREKDMNLDIAKRLANVLKGSGYKVFLTRTDDRYISLRERTNIARKHNADLFVSIHANANKKPSVTGFETYYLDFSDNPRTIRLAAVENAGVDRKGLGEMEKILGDMLLKARVQESKRLANMVQHNAIKKTGADGYRVKNGGARGAPFHVLIGASMPSVLIEVGYSSNQTEAKRLSTSKYRDSLAEGIANGLHQYASQLLNVAAH